MPGVSFCVVFFLLAEGERKQVMLLVSSWEDYYLIIIIAPLLLAESAQVLTKLIIHKKLQRALRLLQEEAEKNNHQGSNWLLMSSHYRITKWVTASYIVFKCYIVIQGALVALKYDELIEWDWIQALWLTWILLALGIGTSICSFAMFLVRLYASLVNSEPWKDGNLFQMGFKLILPSLSRKSFCFSVELRLFPAFFHFVMICFTVFFPWE